MDLDGPPDLLLVDASKEIIVVLIKKPPSQENDNREGALANGTAGGSRRGPADALKGRGLSAVKQQRGLPGRMGTGRRWRGWWR